MRLYILCVIITALVSISIALTENEKLAGDQLVKKITEIVKKGSGYGYVFDQPSYSIIYGKKRLRVRPNRKALSSGRRTPRQPSSHRKPSHHGGSTSVASDQIL